MKRKTFGLIAGLSVILTAAPLLAHHSFSAEYDSKKPVQMKGVVTKVDWMNPHVWFYLDVTDEKGAITNWGFEMGPPNGLERAGWNRNTMTVGDEVTVDGSMSKDGSKQVNARSVTMTNSGKRLGAASSEGNR